MITDVEADATVEALVERNPMGEVDGLNIMKMKWAMMGRNNAMACVGDGNRLSITNVQYVLQRHSAKALVKSRLGCIY
ncbi:hypothetical protein Tco_0348014 [Tanacetum coccineum]